jgi:hypothetical protein
MFEIKVPRSYYELVKDIPADELPEDAASLPGAITEELLNCLDYAAQAKEPQIVFGDMERAGSQFIWEFYVNDLSKARIDSYNWHGQNVSQWLYAGAIVLQGKTVSRHH